MGFRYDVSIMILLAYVIIIAGQGHTTKQNRNKQTNTNQTKELISSYNWQRSTINNSQAPPS